MGGLSQIGKDWLKKNERFYSPKKEGRTEKKEKGWPKKWEGLTWKMRRPNLTLNMGSLSQNMKV